MKNILVPMDFTDVGLNALRYTLNGFPKSKITVLHVKVGTIDADDPLYSSPGMIQIDFWKKALKAFIQKELKDPKISKRINIEVAYGPIISTIKACSESGKYDAVIMGSRDKYNYFDQWFGTVSIGTVKTIDLPIYLIPKYATFSGIRKVMVASDDKISDPTLIKRIKEWNTDYHAYIKFLHIQDGKGAFQDETKQIVTELFEKQDPDFSFEVSILRDKDVAQSLLGSAYDFGADLLMVIPENQTFLQSLVFKSISKDLILRADIPLLFI